MEETTYSELLTLPLEVLSVSHLVVVAVHLSFDRPKKPIGNWQALKQSKS